MNESSVMSNLDKPHEKLNDTICQVNLANDTLKPDDQLVEQSNKPSTDNTSHDRSVNQSQGYLNNQTNNQSVVQNQLKSSQSHSASNDEKQPVNNLVLQPLSQHNQTIFNQPNQQSNSQFNPQINNQAINSSIAQELMNQCLAFINDQPTNQSGNYQSTNPPLSQLAEDHINQTINQYINQYNNSLQFAPLPNNIQQVLALQSFESNGSTPVTMKTTKQLKSDEYDPAENNRLTAQALADQELEDRSRVSCACSNCKRAKARCDNKRPCDRCLRTGKQSTCVDSVHLKRGRKQNRREEHLESLAAKNNGFQTSMVAQNRVVPAVPLVQHTVPDPGLLNDVKRMRVDPVSPVIPVMASVLPNNIPSQNVQMTAPSQPLSNQQSQYFQALGINIPPNLMTSMPSQITAIPPLQPPNHPNFGISQQLQQQTQQQQQQPLTQQQSQNQQQQLQQPVMTTGQHPMMQVMQQHTLQQMQGGQVQQHQLNQHLQQQINQLANSFIPNLQRSMSSPASFYPSSFTQGQISFNQSINQPINQRSGGFLLNATQSQVQQGTVPFNMSYPNSFMTNPATNNQSVAPLGNIQPNAQQVSISQQTLNNILSQQQNNSALSAMMVPYPYNPMQQFMNINAPMTQPSASTSQIPKTPNQ